MAVLPENVLGCAAALFQAIPILAKQTQESLCLHSASWLLSSLPLCGISDISLRSADPSLRVCCLRGVQFVNIRRRQVGKQYETRLVRSRLLRQVPLISGHLILGDKARLSRYQGVAGFPGPRPSFPSFPKARHCADGASAFALPRSARGSTDQAVCAARSACQSH